MTSFKPPDMPDPTGDLPAKSYVMSVALVAGRDDAWPQYVLISDMHAGPYVLEVSRPD